MVRGLELKSTIHEQLKEEQNIYEKLEHDKTHSLGINSPNVYCYTCKRWIKWKQQITQSVHVLIGKKSLYLINIYQKDLPV